MSKLSSVNNERRYCWVILLAVNNSREIFYRNDEDFSRDDDKRSVTPRLARVDDTRTHIRVEQQLVWALLLTRMSRCFSLLLLLLLLYIYVTTTKREPWICGRRLSRIIIIVSIGSSKMTTVLVQRRENDDDDDCILTFFFSNDYKPPPMFSSVFCVCIQCISSKVLRKDRCIENSSLQKTITTTITKKSNRHLSFLDIHARNIIRVQ